MTQTILIVDDEPEIVKVLRGYLEQAGFRVITAPDGAMAITQSVGKLHGNQTSAQITSYDRAVTPA